MSFQNQIVVVLGATGVVGSGVVRAYLEAGATVVGVSRSAEKLERLKAQLSLEEEASFLAVIGDFVDEPSAQATRRAVAEALQGRPVDHVVTVLGFVNFAGAPTESPLDSLKQCLADGLYNNFLAAKVFLPELKGRAGASFTLVSGGLAHIPPPNPTLWLGTVKNAALNALTLALAAETAGDAVRVNTVCIHFSVAPVGGDKNQFGMPSESDTRRLGPAFLGVARGAHKGRVLCLSSWADADRLATS